MRFHIKINPEPALIDLSCMYGKNTNVKFCVIYSDNLIEKTNGHGIGYDSAVRSRQKIW